MVRFHLDYAIQTSVPHFQKDIKLTERMQRLTTRYVRSFRKLAYPERLYELRLSSMQRHIPHVTRITVYKLFNGYQSLSANEFFEAPAAGKLREHDFKVRQPRFILPGGKWLSLFVRSGRGIDCPHTQLKLRRCPASRIAWMPNGAPFSLTLFDPTSFIVLM